MHASSTRASDHTGAAGAMSAREGRRPAAVTMACATAAVMSACVGLISLLTAFMAGLAGDTLMEEVRRQQPDFDAMGVSDDALLRTATAMCVVFAIWSLVAIVLAGFAWVGRRWAAWALAVSAAAAGAFALLPTFTAIFPIVVVVTGAFVAVTLLRADVRAWYAAGAEATRRH